MCSTNRAAPHRRARPAEAGHRQLPGRQEELCEAPNHPQKPELGKRRCRSRRSSGSSARTSWRRRARATSASSPATRCACATASSSNAPAATRMPPATSSAVHCNYFPDSKSGTPGVGHLQGQGQHPLGLGAARLCRRGAALRPPVQGTQPGRRTRLPRRHQSRFGAPISAQLEPSLQDAAPEDRFQFERHGYFVADRVDSQPGAPVFNRAVTLKDSWAKAK
jgi:glutaminyl-tRNA synthetase